MKHKNPVRITPLKYAETWIFGIASVFLILFIVIECRIHGNPTPLPHSVLLRVLLLLIICALFYLATLLNVRRQQIVRRFQTLLGGFFLLYLYLLLSVTLLEKGFGRASLAMTREEYLGRFVNLVPFRSIYGVYIRGFLNGAVNSYYTFLNLLGNLVAFMPFAFFLPVFFKAQRHALIFIATIFSIVTGTECLQFLFMVGSCDIDDLILNTIGAIGLYFLLRCTPCKRLVARVFGKDWLHEPKSTEKV